MVRNQGERRSEIRLIVPFQALPSRYEPEMRNQYDYDQQYSRTKPSPAFEPVIVMKLLFGRSYLADLCGSHADFSAHRR
jgi:hypothetical protein